MYKKTADARLLDVHIHGAVLIPVVVSGMVAGKSEPKTLIYVSCGFDALQRDTEVLVEEGGWHVTHAGDCVQLAG